MAQFNPQALATLLRMPSTQNVSAAPSRRSLDVLSGADQLAPDPNSPELMAAQERLSQDTGMGFSREALRNSALDSIRQKLGIGQIAHQQQMDLGKQKGEFDVQVAKANDAGQDERFRYGQAQIGARQEANQAAIMDRLQQTIAAQGTRQEDAQAARAALPSTAAQVPAPMAKSFQDARAGYEGFHPLNSLQRGLGMTPAADTRYEQSLTDVLSRQGTLSRAQAMAQDAVSEGKSADQFAGEAAQHGIQLSPYEIQYLKLKTGR